jgi:hypothetical protein
LAILACRGGHGMEWAKAHIPQNILAYCCANSGACPKKTAKTREIATRSDVRMLALLTLAAI